MPHALASIGRVTELSIDDAPGLLALVRAHEAAAVFSAFSASTAWELGTALRETYLSSYHTDEASTGVVIHVELFTGLVLFSAAVGRPPVIGPDNWAWVRAKANVVKRFGVSSLRKGREIAAKKQTPEEKGLGMPEYACHGGGFPLWVKGVDAGPVGAVVVSGLPQLVDHQLIVDSLVKVSHLLV
ncbi:hypothetical protein Q5752_003913 [Cryptotrichosporon argae]